MPPLDAGWQLTSTAAGSEGPPGPKADWMPATVPGTVAGALAAAGRPPDVGDDRIDQLDWWFRAPLSGCSGGSEGDAVLRLGGVATVWEAFVDGRSVAAGDSMFEPATVRLTGGDELAICCRALAPLLEGRRKPRARWRTKLAAGNLRFYRTTLLGRAPGFSPGPPPIGPWRPVTLEPGGREVATELRLLPRVEGEDGVLAVGVDQPASSPIEVRVNGPSGEQALELRDGYAELRVPGVALWWPHTHGGQPLYDVTVTADGAALASRRVGFRSLANAAGEVDVGGVALEVNGVPVFARGAVWTPVDPIGLAAGEPALRAALGHVRDAGMNMVRLPGTGVYESDAFHDLCDELGILVWQDLMFANFDYPIADAHFRAAVESEVRRELGRVAGRPSLAVVCGNSEVEQQAAMFGAESGMAREELFGELIPRLVEESGADASYVPSAPCGGPLPFTPSSGVANYFGVGGYRRPLADARLAGVRFASECLAFANPPDGGDPREGFSPRDVGSPWDFHDVRDHYLELLHDVDPERLREADPERYAALSRAVPGEVMAEVMGEWRRDGSPCRGALILCMRDALPGAGWGLVTAEGTPKEAYHHLRRRLAPVACWTTDEGLGGIGVHVANDRGASLAAMLRVSLYKDGEQLVDERETELALGPHSAWSEDVEALLGHFRDVAYAYRFGPPAQDAVVVSLLEAGRARLLSQDVRFPAGPPAGRTTAEELGLRARLQPTGDGPTLSLSSRALVYDVRLSLPGFSPAVDAFTLEPGRERIIALKQAEPRPGPAAVTALNLEGVLVPEGEVVEA